MKSLFKIGKLKLVGIIAILPVLAAGTVFAYNISTPSKTVNESAQTKQEVKTDKTSKQTDNSEPEDTTSIDQTASEPTRDTSTQSTSQTPTANPTQPATNTAPQQTATTPTPTTPTCNESMKSSYTSLYNSQVNAENASWNNQINAWNDYAAGHGMSFSGYTQSQIDANKPAHDARLAQLQTQYYQNLASINCTP